MIGPADRRKVIGKEGALDMRLRRLRGGATGLSALLAVALCATLLFAVPASAKVAEYEASLKGPGGNKGYISFKVKSKKDKQSKKFRPVLIKKFGLFADAECSDGVGENANFYPSLAPWPTLIPVSGRHFSLSDSGGYPTTDGTYKYDIDFSGDVPRHGPPTGTLRYMDSSPRLVPDPTNPDGPYISAQVACDTGPTTWTAKRLPPGTL